MSTPRQRCSLECEVLESRRCPSTTAGTSFVYVAPDQPVERFDSLAVTQHAADLAAAAAGQASNVVFLGDSITQWFAGGIGSTVWSQKIAPLGAADLGVAGDTTQNLLWRIDNGELAGQPRLAVLMIGTNNLGTGVGVAETVAGIEADITAIRQASPGTQILLNGLFPRGQASDVMRGDVAQVNAALSSLAGSLGVAYLNPGASMANSQGSIASDFQSDLIHPDAHGYQAWADGIVGTVRQILTYVPATVTQIVAPPPTAMAAQTPVLTTTTPVVTPDPTVVATVAPATKVATTTPETLVTPPSVATTVPVQGPVGGVTGSSVATLLLASTGRPGRVAQVAVSYQPLTYGHDQGK
jgi:lysophospholipase L1-like esterase